MAFGITDYMEWLRSRFTEAQAQYYYCVRVEEAMKRHKKKCRNVKYRLF